MTAPLFGDWVLLIGEPVSGWHAYGLLRTTPGRKSFIGLMQQAPVECNSPDFEPSEVAA